MARQSNDGKGSLSDEQTTAVESLQSALEGLAEALLSCRSAGLEPADAFRAAGIEIPAFAGPALNHMLRSTEATT